MATEPAPRSSIQPLGTNGDQRRRFLFHHVPIVVASVAILLAFMTVPLFDANAYPHGDVVSGPFPEERRESRPTSHGVDRTGGHVVSALLMHVSHGSQLFASFLHFFVAEDGSPLTNSFGLGNWTGLAAVAIVLGLHPATPPCGNSKPRRGSGCSV